MPSRLWSVRDAKKRFGALLAAAQRMPQTVRGDGKSAVVVIAAGEYERLRQLEKRKALDFVDHLLAMPTSDVELERLDCRLREIDL
jgi:antitoxin Phd